MCDAKDDATRDADSMTLYWSAMRIRSVENFDLLPNIDHKRKGDGVVTGGKCWWPKQVMTIEVGSRGGGEGGVDSKDREGKSGWHETP